MAVERTSPREHSGVSEPEGATAKPAAAGRFRRLLLGTWLPLLVIVSLAMHAGGLAYYRFHQRATAAPASPEIGLGVFHFTAGKGDIDRIRAQFSVHVALAEPVEAPGRQRLAARKVRVRQDIEELIRKAHSGDFDDPGLQELKRQLLEQVNQTLGLRAISEVMITDLEIQPGGPQQPAPGQTAQAAPPGRANKPSATADR
ncbi:MAG: flagellar basal body-associated FliL family protein [Thermoguttaceae bacterium]|jgi:flagellar basal body-associated protein FliL